MEPLDIFYLILDEDLNLFTNQTTKNLKVEYSKNWLGLNEITGSIKTIKKHLFYYNLLANTLKKVKLDIHDNYKYF